MMQLASITLSLALGLSYGAQIQTIQGEEAFFDTALRSGSMSCPTTLSEYDRDHYCRCSPGQSMSYIESEHDNGKDDRKWLVKCKAIPGGGFSTDKVNVTAFSEYKSHQRFDVQAVPLYQRLNKGECFDECTENGRGQGNCGWCGLEGLCCRKGSSWIGNGCDGHIGEKDHHMCVSKPVPGLINGRDQCWSECNKRDGKCDFCGSNGFCCRKGYNKYGCDGKIGGNDHHICVTYPGPGLENMGETCWYPCDKKEGACGFCGLDGVCCRKGYTGNGCDGKIGGDDDHRCASKPEKTNGFIVGMESHHSNKKEDRRFSFFWQESPNHSLEDCSWTTKLNDFDQPKFDYTLPEGKVIAGVESFFDDGKNDRKFYLKLCTLAKKCAVIGTQPVYDWDKKTMEYDPAGEVAGTNSLNNLKHDQIGELTVEVSQTNTHKLANSYSYSYVSGHEMTASLDVTAGVTWGVGPVAEASVEVAAGFSSTWSTEETWTRDNSQEITEANGFKTTWKTVCGAHSYCQANIIMQTGVAKVPYTLVSHTVGNPAEKCTEEGILTIKRSWDAKMIIASYKRCPCMQGDVGCSSDGKCSCLTSADQCRDDGNCSSYTCKTDED